MTPEAHADSPVTPGRSPRCRSRSCPIQSPSTATAAPLRGIGCGDCVVTVLLGGPPFGVPLDDDERRAIDVLADAGLVPPLRMVQARESRHSHPEA